jgi:hypothetical protein
LPERRFFTLQTPKGAHKSWVFSVQSTGKTYKCHRLLEEDGEDGDAYIYRAQIHWLCGEAPDALEDLERGFDLDADDWAYTANEMYRDDIKPPERIVDALRESGYIDEDEEEV